MVLDQTIAHVGVDHWVLLSYRTFVQIAVEQEQNKLIG